MAGKQDPCATDGMLQQLLLGQVPRDQASRLEVHVLGCRRCGERLAGIQAEDTLVEAAHAWPTEPDWSDDKQLQALVDRLCHLPMPTTGHGSAQLPAAEGPSEEVLDEMQRFLAPAESPDELGRVGGYRVLKVLGSGGMGIVMEAVDTQLGRRVALKVMKPMLAVSLSARTRFLREARAAAAIQHDNVVTIYHVGEHRGLPFLAMQLLDGEPLSRRLARQGKLPPTETIRIGRQIAAGLAAAHARDVVHRDIKPDNIWLERAGDRDPTHDRVKILDFGLAHVADNLPRLTQSGAVAGTPAYMAPEQIANELVDPRADLFSLGCALYEMSTGRRAFAGSTVAATLLAVTQQKPPSPRQVDSDAPKPLSDLVMKLLEKDPRHRYQSADEVQGALAKCALTPCPSPEYGRGEQGGPQRATGGWSRGTIAAIALAAAFVVLLAAALISIKTSAGTLIVEVNQPDVSVTIDGEKVLLRSPRDQVEVRVGQHELEVRKDGFHTFTQSFEIARGGKVEVSARLEPLPSPPAPLPSPVLGRGGVPGTPGRGEGAANCITTVADGDALIEWLRKNDSRGPQSRLVSVVKAFMEKQIDDGNGFYFMVGPGAIKSGMLTVLCSHNGQFFVAELPPNLSKRSQMADNAAVEIQGAKTIARVDEERAKLIAFTIDGAEDMEATQEIVGSVRLRDFPEKEGDYLLHLTFLNVDLYEPLEKRSQVKNQNLEKVPFRFAAPHNVGRRGPIVVFLELCRYTNVSGNEYVVVSNTIATVVNVRP